MNTRPSRYAVAALLLVAGLTACGQAQDGAGPSGGTSSTSATTAPPPAPVAPPVTVPASGRVTVTGVPQAGVEASCVMLGRYLLVGGTPPQRALLDAGRRGGTTVTVSGHTDTTQASYCQQGTLLVVDDVRADG